MEPDLPRPVQDAARVLLEACLRAASERDDVRRSLVTLNAWLARELDRLGRGERAAGSGHGVLTPAARGRDDRPAAQVQGQEPHDPQKRITEILSVVVTRARWKAAACRLALDRRATLAMSDGEKELSEAQMLTRERSLRTRLAGLPDTSTWMLDQPFGVRATEPKAFEVADDVAAKLERVALCYETLAFAAETATDLDESGVFRGGPPPQFLYLLAEAQSSLLASLADAPTRSDSDQRDVFLWLKDQTTRYRIYVDRHMRLDDPADPNGSSDLEERIRRASRELSEERQVRRQRGQLLNKIRYHVRKLLHDGALRLSEVESLAAALERGFEAGLERGDRTLVELFAPLRELTAGAIGEAAERLTALTETIASPGADAASAGHSSSSANAKSADATSDDENDATTKDPERSARILGEVRALLQGRRVVLLARDITDDEGIALEKELGATSVKVVMVDVESEEAERWKVLDACLADEAVDLFLLGVRLDTDEYQRFKERCLERKTPFVRLPGSFAATAVAHQITRQVGWRLRAQRDSSVS